MSSVLLNVSFCCKSHLKLSLCVAVRVYHFITPSDQSILSALNDSNVTCSHVSAADLSPHELNISLSWLAVAKMLVWIMSAIGLLIEVRASVHIGHRRAHRGTC